MSAMVTTWFIDLYAINGGTTIEIDQIRGTAPTIALEPTDEAPAAAKARRKAIMAEAAEAAELNATVEAKGTPKEVLESPVAAPGALQPQG